MSNELVQFEVEYGWKFQIFSKHMSRKLRLIYSKCLQVRAVRRSMAPVIVEFRFQNFALKIYLKCLTILSLSN